MKIKKLLSSSNDPGSLGSKFRSKRLSFFQQLFEKTFKNQQKINILDVGGTQEFWRDRSIAHHRNVTITLLNLEKEQVNLPNFNSVAGDAINLSAFEDKSFDLVFSNSVIEHVHTFDNQQQMAREIRRVGKRYFVQTPNKYFFIEPHYALPFFQFMPSPFVFFILTRTKLSRFQKWDRHQAKNYLEEIRLLSLGEMKKLFPEGKVYREKLFGMDKSFTLHNLSL